MRASKGGEVMVVVVLGVLGSVVVMGVGGLEEVLLDLEMEGVEVDGVGVERVGVEAVELSGVAGEMVEVEGVEFEVVEVEAVEVEVVEVEAVEVETVEVVVEVVVEVEVAPLAGNMMSPLMDASLLNFEALPLRVGADSPLLLRNSSRTESSSVSTPTTVRCFRMRCCQSLSSACRTR